MFLLGNCAATEGGGLLSPSSLAGVAAIVERVSKLEFLGNDIHGFDFGVSDKQLFSACEECLGYLTVDVNVSSILILEGIEYAERCGRDFEREPRCRPSFCLYQWAG